MDDIVTRLERLVITESDDHYKISKNSLDKTLHETIRDVIDEIESLERRVDDLHFWMSDDID
jgi:hypothetical protein